MKRLSSLAFALCAALAAGSAWAQDTAAAPPSTDSAGPTSQAWPAACRSRPPIRGADRPRGWSIPAHESGLAPDFFPPENAASAV